MGSISEKQFLEKALSLTRASFTDARTAEVEQKRIDLRRLAADAPSPQIGRRLAGSTLALVLWHQDQGLVRISDGDASGWQNLRDVLYCERLNGRVIETAFQRATGGGALRADLTSLGFSDVLLALHLGDLESADFTMQRLESQSRDPDAQNWRFKTGALRFQAKLYEVLRGREASLDWTQLPELGGYEALLADGLSDAQYAPALDWACREHLDQSATRKAGVSVFTGKGYGIMPIELMSWRRYRRARGLRHDTNGHALLDSPLAALDVPPPLVAPTPFRELIDSCLPHYRAYLDG